MSGFRTPMSPDEGRHAIRTLVRARGPTETIRTKCRRFRAACAPSDPMLAWACILARSLVPIDAMGTTWGPDWHAEMVSRLRPVTTGEWQGEGPRRGRPLDVRTFTLSTFAVQNEKVVAVGTLSAVLATAAGPGLDTSVVSTVALPVNIRQSSPETLGLDIGPITLDLLGLQVNLGQMVLDLTAQAGPAHLLSAVDGVRDDPAGLARLLNKILETL